MKAAQLVEHGFYYLLTFADAEQTVPGVEPMVFLGVDAIPREAQESERKFWFQDTVSFARFGNATKYAGPQDLSKEGCYLRSFPESDIGSDVLDLDGVIAALHAAKGRAPSP